MDELLAALVFLAIAITVMVFAVQWQDRQRDLSAFLCSHRKWEEATFPGETLQSKAQHLLEEAMEVAANPYDLEEYADLAIMLFASARKASYTEHDVIDAMWKKFEVNRKRKWKGGRHV